MTKVAIKTDVIIERKGYRIRSCDGKCSLGKAHLIINLPDERQYLIMRKENSWGIEMSSTYIRTSNRKYSSFYDAINSKVRNKKISLEIVRSLGEELL